MNDFRKSAEPNPHEHLFEAIEALSKSNSRLGLIVSQSYVSMKLKTRFALAAIPLYPRGKEKVPRVAPIREESNATRWRQKSISPTAAAADVARLTDRYVRAPLVDTAPAHSFLSLSLSLS